jgi:hypothetical protein
MRSYQRIIREVGPKEKLECAPGILIWIHAAADETLGKTRSI